MRVLLRDQSDNTYIVLDAESVYYDEPDQELYKTTTIPCIVS